MGAERLMMYRMRFSVTTAIIRAPDATPCAVPHCQGEMALWRMWHPKYGVIYDEANRIRRGDCERRRERTPTDLDGQVARRALA